MTMIEQPDWQRRRSDFNHQWLKNRLLSALDTADHVIRGRVHGTGYLQELIEVDMPEWKERRDDLGALLRDFVVQMSPRQMFNFPPLANLEPTARELFSELMHELWLVRHPVAEWVEGAKTASSEVNKHYERLVKIAPLDAKGKVRPEFATEFEQFRSACRALSKAIEKFPNRILVT